MIQTNFAGCIQHRWGPGADERGKERNGPSGTIWVCVEGVALRGSCSVAEVCGWTGVTGDTVLRGILGGVVKEGPRREAACGP